MKKVTHLLLGTAVALPIAVSASPGIAIGALWFGAVGGGWPDWFDLRSDFRQSMRLRHRGASHGIPFGIAMTLALWWFLSLLTGETVVGVRLPADAVMPWTVAFGLGFLSHLLSDACTHAGIQPLLPFSRIRVWMLPRMMRGTSSGPLDFLVRWAAFTALLLGIGYIVLA